MLEDFRFATSPAAKPAGRCRNPPRVGSCSVAVRLWVRQERPRSGSTRRALPADRASRHACIIDPRARVASNARRLVATVSRRLPLRSRVRPQLQGKPYRRARTAEMSTAARRAATRLARAELGAASGAHAAAVRAAWAGRARRRRLAGDRRTRPGRGRSSARSARPSADSPRTQTPSPPRTPTTTASSTSTARSSRTCPPA